MVKTATQGLNIKANSLLPPHFHPPSSKSEDLSIQDTLTGKEREGKKRGREREAQLIYPRLVGGRESSPPPVGARSGLQTPPLGSSEKRKTYQRMWSPDPAGLQIHLRSFGKMLIPWDPPLMFQFRRPATEPGNLNFNKAPSLGTMSEPLFPSSGEEEY